MATTREDMVMMAKLAEQADRHDEMVDQMCKLVQLVISRGDSLNEDERNLFSVAFKNQVGARRSAYRNIASVEAKTTDERLKKLAFNYRMKIFKELEAKSNEIIKLLDDSFLQDPNESSADCYVFFMKMKGDYCRYLCEPSTDVNVNRKQSILDASKAYETANTHASSLPATHPVKLGLALNHSVFHYEIMENSEKACHIAKTAFDDAMLDLETTDDDKAKDATLIMQLLRDNISLWTQDHTDDN